MVVKKMVDILLLILSLCSLIAAIIIAILLVIIFVLIKDEMKTLKISLKNLTRKENKKEFLYITDQDEEAFVPKEGEKNG